MSKTSNHLPKGKLLALDVSIAAIGIATCDPLWLGAQPHSVIKRRSRRADFDTLATVYRDAEAVGVICGLPLNMDGTEGERAEYIRRWAMKLAHGLRALVGEPVPIIFWDERLSTFAAQEYLASDHNGRTAKNVGEDAAAAAVILQSYLDAQSRNDPQEYGRIDLPPKEK